MTADYEVFHFNTMVAKLMELTNTLFRYRGSSVAGGEEWDEAIRLLLLMLAPAAPHVTEELWSRRLAANGEAWSSIHKATWPRSTRRRRPSRPARSRSRSTARSATGSSWPANADAAGIEAAGAGLAADPAAPRRAHAGPHHPGRRRKLVNLVVPE